MKNYGEEWENIKAEISRMDIPRDKRAPSAIVFLATLILGALFTPLAWVIAAASVYYAGGAFIKLRKFRNSAADSDGLFGFGAANDRYALAGIAAVCFIGFGISGGVLIPAAVAAGMFYGILRFTATIRGQDRRRRNSFDGW